MKEVYLTTEAERRYRKAYYERNKARILQKKKERYHADAERARADNKRHRANSDRSEYFRKRYLEKKAREQSE